MRTQAFVLNDERHLPVVSALAAGLLLMAATGLPAFGHQPIFSDGTNNSPASALEIEDIGLSQVFYAQLTADSPQLWITFQAEAGQELYVQLGLPQIDRLSDFRPALLLIGPGLPANTTSIQVPTGLGAESLVTGTVAEPEAFYEPFTGTNSWILAERTLPLPEAGRYYIVAYASGGQFDKLWVAVGKREEFGLADFARFGQITAQVREFHEMPTDAAPPCFLFPAAAALIGLGAVSLIRSKSNRQSTTCFQL